MAIKIEETFETDKKEEFLKEYRALCRKYGYDFIVPPPTLIKVDFPPEKPIKFEDITPK